ncbi:CotH kinase family protein [Nocardiopsis baichengensis]|uniref:CotH kinase family protein n=1 Tax=Nocardiopsis baichengensis TaxID=280240 RepID=UPI0005947576|nr:CotH kinase family protein [Nocardiopsis baichengensis]
MAVPVRVRRHWRTAAAVCAALLALVVFFGDARIRPYTTSDPVSEEAVTQDIEGEGDLFDGGGHTIEVSYDPSQYADMIDTFRTSGEKEYIKADVVIDGTAVEDVGLRLKGNSTLSSLRGGGQGGTVQQGRGPGGVSLSEDEPEALPWLVSFDEYVEGRAYQGSTEIALRPATSTSDTALNEALALGLTEAAGQTTQDLSFTALSVNGGDAEPRIVLDAPDAPWADGLGDGVLYKARAEGSFDYLGDDPTDYEDAFKQINAEGAYDLQPVMDLLEFVDEAGDEEFASELDEHVDVESFASYLALQDLMSNGDAMDGPGNNYYLWYDAGEDRFTVLSWDLNMAFGGMGMMGGGPGGRGGAEGMQPPEEGMQAPEGREPPGGGDGGGGPGMGGSGALKERFLENDEFAQLYEEAYADLYESLVQSGTAADLLDSEVAQAQAVGDEEAASAQEALAEQIASIPEESA